MARKRSVKHYTSGEMRSSISNSIPTLVPNRFNVIGSVAIVSIDSDREDKRRVAEALILEHKEIKTVLNKVSKLEGDRRVASFEVLAGGETVTLHREFGFVYKLDVSSVFFNSRLGYERARIASMAKPGEKVLIPFSGVGPFVVPIAARGSNVVAAEKNPEACRWLAENIRLNRVEENVSIIRGDAFVLSKMLRQKFDVVVIPTPYGQDEILKAIRPLVRKGGRVHFYTFKKMDQIEGLIEGYEKMGFQVEFYRRCGNVAPAVSRWAFDLTKC